MKKNYLVSITALILSLLSSQSVLAGLFERPDFFEQGRKQFEQEIRRLQRGQSVSESPLKIDLSSVSWMRFIFRKEGFTIIMPAGAITQETEMVKTPRGEIKFDLIASHPPDSRFVVAYSEEVSAEQRTEPSDVLNWSRNYITENTDGGFTMVVDENIVFKNYPGKDFTLKNQDETIMFRLLWIKQRLYVLAVSQEKQEISQEIVTKFFDSLEILEQ